MPKKIDWDHFDTLGSGGSNGTGRKFFKFRDGTIVRCRPIGGGIAFTKFYNRSTKKSICVETEDAPAIAKYILEKTGVEIKPQDRFAINAIDRADADLKVLEGSFAIFKVFGSWAKEVGEDKGEKISVGHGVYGGDWKIEANGEGKLRRYTTTFIKERPVTKEEKEKIDGMLDDLDLNKVFKVCPKDKVIQWLFDKADDSEPEGEGPAPSAPHDDEEEETVGAGTEESGGEYDF